MISIPELEKYAKEAEAFMGTEVHRFVSFCKSKWAEGQKAVETVETAIEGGSEQPASSDAEVLEGSGSDEAGEGSGGPNTDAPAGDAPPPAPAPGAADAPAPSPAPAAPDAAAATGNQDAPTGEASANTGG